MKNIKNLVQKIRLYIKRWHIMAMIIILTFAVDMITKEIAKVDFKPGINVIKDFFWLTFVENRGAAWGSFNGNTAFLLISTVLSLALMGYFIKLYKDYSKIVFAVTIAIGGTFGNMYERVFNGGAVTDFIKFQVFGYNFPVFNFADIFVVGGMIGAIVFALIAEKNKKKLGGSNDKK